MLGLFVNLVRDWRVLTNTVKSFILAVANNGPEYVFVFFSENLPMEPVL